MFVHVFNDLRNFTVLNLLKLIFKRSVKKLSKHVFLNKLQKKKNEKCTELNKNKKQIF